MRERIISATFATLTLAMPLIVHAQAMQSIVTTLTRITNYALGLLIGIAILGFCYGLVRYLLSAKGGADQRKASLLMVYGVIALFVMLSIFGIIHLLQVTLGIDGNPAMNAPQYGKSVLQKCTSPTANFGCLAQWVAKFFAIGTALLVGASLVLYFSGVAFSMFKYSAGGSTDSIRKLRMTILWGLLALFIMFSIWGIINVLGNTLFGSSNFNSPL